MRFMRWMGSIGGICDLDNTSYAYIASSVACSIVCVPVSKALAINHGAIETDDSALAM
jgi:hypothetical protein